MRRGRCTELATPMLVVEVSPIGNETHQIENNCAIAFVLTDIFPGVYVTNLCIFSFGIAGDKEKMFRYAPV
jgi:hypothetical protein